MVMRRQWQQARTQVRREDAGSEEGIQLIKPSRKAIVFSPFRLAKKSAQIKITGHRSRELGIAIHEDGQREKRADTLAQEVP